MTTEKKYEITALVAQSGVEAETAVRLQDRFKPFVDQINEWCDKAMALVVTDETQLDKIKEAIVASKALSSVLGDVEKTRKKLKENSLREGQAIDKIARTIRELVEPIKAHIDQQKDFIKLQDLKRREERKKVREQRLIEYVSDTSFYDLLNMPDEDFDRLFDGIKAAHEARIESEKKEEQDRVAREKAEAQERERVRIENERLKAEAQEKEKQLAQERAKVEAERKAVEEKAQKERAAAEARLKAEREENEKLQAQIRAEFNEAKAKADAAIEKERIEKERLQQIINQQAQAQPTPPIQSADPFDSTDRNRLIDLAEMIEAIQVPDNYMSNESKKVAANVRVLLKRVGMYIRENSPK